MQSIVLTTISKSRNPSASLRRADMGRSNSSMLGRILWVILLLLSSNVIADPPYNGYYIVVSPPQPRDVDVVTIGFSKLCGGLLEPPNITYTITDNTIDINYRTSCASFTSMQIEDQIQTGPLAAGTYTVRVWDLNREGRDGPYAPAFLGAITVFEVVASNPVAAAVEEFYHSGLNHYFITADPAEAQTLLDHTQPGWTPTGQSFRAFTSTSQTDGATAAVCRFYGSVSPGPNSHFYTLFADECAVLKTLQQSTPASVPRWNYEGVAFVATLPQVGGTCPATAPLPVRRFYNLRALQNDSNHRYVTDPAIATDMRTKGWRDEGVVMCATPAS